MGQAADADPWLTGEGSSPVKRHGPAPRRPGSSLSPQGMYCQAADAWIDPWRAVPRALITATATADHARHGASGASCGVAAAKDVLAQDG